MKPIPFMGSALDGEYPAFTRHSVGSIPTDPTSATHTQWLSTCFLHRPYGVRFPGVAPGPRGPKRSLKTE